MDVAGAIRGVSYALGSCRSLVLYIFGGRIIESDLQIGRTDRFWAH